MFNSSLNFDAVDKLTVKLAKKVDDVDSLLENIGVALDNATRDRMDEELSPDLQKWAPLQGWYAKTKRNPKMLQEQGTSGGLIQSLNYQINSNELTYGSNKVYALIHQEGGTIKPKNAKSLAIGKGKNRRLVKSVTIPQREYLGFGPRETTAINEELDALLKDI